MKKKLLGEHTGLRVSELALGTGRIGTAPSRPVGRAETRGIFAAFADAGGTFFDTSSAYQAGAAEEMVGEFLREAGRDAFVVASKYGRTTSPASPSAAVGNHRRGMQSEIEGSLKRLKTDRIDVYFPHFDDGVTPIEEIMRGLEDLASAGKIIHVGLSNFPAWRIASAAMLAKERGWINVAVVQLQYNLLERSIEREHLPLARATGMAVMGWSPLAGGALTRPTVDGSSDRFQATKEAVAAIAREHSTSPAAVAIRWLSEQNAIPVLGPRTSEHLVNNLKAVELTLTKEQIQKLDDASKTALGYPYDMLKEQHDRLDLKGPRVGATL